MLLIPGSLNLAASGDPDPPVDPGTITITVGPVPITPNANSGTIASIKVGADPLITVTFSGSQTIDSRVAGAVNGQWSPQLELDLSGVTSISLVIEVLTVTEGRHRVRMPYNTSGDYIEFYYTVSAITTDGLGLHDPTIGSPSLVCDAAIGYTTCGANAVIYSATC